MRVVWYPAMKGALLIVARAAGPVWFGKWRDGSGRQVKRRLGPAWVVREPGGWRPRRGPSVDGALDERSALVALAAAIEAHVADALEAEAFKWEAMVYGQQPVEL